MPVQSLTFERFAVVQISKSSRNAVLQLPTSDARSNSFFSPGSSPLNPGSCVVLTLIFNSSPASSLHSEQIREAERRHRELFGFSSVYNFVFTSLKLRGFNKPLDTFNVQEMFKIISIEICFCGEAELGKHTPGQTEREMISLVLTITVNDWHIES